MLGWFKKKFKKQDKAVPQETKVEEDISSDIGLEQELPPSPDSELVVDSPPSTPAQVASEVKEARPPEIVTDAEELPQPDVPAEKLTTERESLEVEESPPADIAHPADIETDTVESADEPDEIQAAFEEPDLQVLETTQDEPAIVGTQVPEVEVQPAVTEAAQAVDKIIEEESLAKEVKPEVDPELVDTPSPAKKKSLFSRLSERLGKTKETFTYQLDALFLGKKEISVDLLDDLEEILITADLGVSTSQELIEYARRKVTRKELSDVDSFKKALKKKIRRFIIDNDQDATLVMPKKGPFVIMVIGVNGVGKTTTIGKIANKFTQSGSSVLLAACDTFRAAAVAQLKIWGERNNVEVVSHKEGADPSSVAFDAIEIAQSKDIDVVLVDTAGRMHTKDNLMEELKKIKRVMAKKLSGAPHEVLLVIDATTGQNGISQAKLFDAAVDVSGITLTKLDGTSKGGIVVNICREMKIPIRFIGIGEQMDDLRDFDPSEFVDALFDTSGTSPS